MSFFGVCTISQGKKKINLRFKPSRSVLSFCTRNDHLFQFKFVKCNLTTTSLAVKWFISLAVKRFTSLAVKRFTSVAVKRFTSVAVKRPMSGQYHKCRLTWYVVALYTARICEFFIERLCSGLSSGSFSVFSSFIVIFGAAVLQRVFSCILFLSTILQGVHVVTFFKDANHKQQLVYNVFCSYRVVAFW